MRPLGLGLLMYSIGAVVETPDKGIIKGFHRVLLRGYEAVDEMLTMANIYVSIYLSIYIPLVGLLIL